MHEFIKLPIAGEAKRKCSSYTSKSVLLWMAATFLLHHAASALVVAQMQPQVLRGVVTLDQPIDQGTILLYDGAELLQSQSDVKFYNGTFSLSLNATATSALAAGKLRMAVQTNASGDSTPITLMLDAGQMDAASRVAFVNPVTTVAANYHDLHPALSVAQATSVSNAALGLGSACHSTTLSSFDNSTFMAQSRVQSGFTSFARQVASNVDSGRISSLSPSVHAMAAVSPNAVGATPDFFVLFQQVLTTLAQDALKDIPLGEVAIGWVLDEVFKSEDQTTEQLQQIRTQLKGIAQQQDAMLDAVNSLSLQVAQNQQAITDQIKLAAYQNQAQQISSSITDLCDMESQIAFLAGADPAENNVEYARNLRNRIQNNASNDLRNIWVGVEGNGSLVSPGLINRWSDLIGPMGLPFFTNNTYLKSAVPNAKFYLAAELVGLNLQAELGHALVSQRQPSLANKIVRDAFSSNNRHVDIELKRVAHDREVKNLGGRSLYAAVALPDPFDLWTIDTRTETLWMQKTPSCDYPRLANDQTLWRYYLDGRPNARQEAFIVTACLPAISMGVAGQIAGTDLNVTFTVPSRPTWAGLIDSPRKSPAAQKQKPAVWLRGKGWVLNVTNKNSYWSGEVAQSDAGPMVYQTWTNWVVDLQVVDPDRGQFWFNFNNTKDFVTRARLLMSSDAPSKNEDQMFYRSGQYDAFPKGDGLTLK
jgi:hypothetical protein